MTDIIEMEPEVLSPFDTLSNSAVAIRAEGEVVVYGLSQEFKENIANALAWMENKLETDEDFDRAKQAIKDSAEMEKRLKISLDEMLSGQKEVAEAKSEIEGYIASFSTKRKTLDSAVVTRDRDKKKRITDEGKAEINRVISLTAISKHFKADTAAIDNAIKHKKKYSAMEDAVASAVLGQIYSLAWMEKTYLENQELINVSLARFPGMYHDAEALSFNNTENLKLIIAQREAAQELALKKQQEQIAEEARIAKEREDKAEADRLAKIESDRIAKEKADAAAATLAEEARAKISEKADDEKVPEKHVDRSVDILPPDDILPPPVDFYDLPPDPFVDAVIKPDPPQFIYLQLDGDGGGIYSDYRVTWSDKKVFKTDVKYQLVKE